MLAHVVKTTKLGGHFLNRLKWRGEGFGEPVGGGGCEFGWRHSRERCELVF